MSSTTPAHRALKPRTIDTRRKLSRLHKPEVMSLEAWQIALRRQLGREETFALANVGDQPIFSEFHVTNPKSGNAYRVAVRGSRAGSNFCSCPDFATNTLGTCKHIEFTLAQLERRRGARAALVRGWVPPYSEIYVQYGARREVRFRPRADAPGSLLRLAGRYFDSDGGLRPEAAGHFECFVARAARIDPGCRCYDDALALIAQMRDEKRRATRLAAAFPHGNRSTAFKRLLRIELQDYQRHAALFAAQAGRCLIADDMGLGKTIEAIAAVEIMARHFGVERVLVVCPTSLKHQWEREIARAIGRPTVVVGGFRTRREAGFRAKSFYKVANYDTVHQDLDLIRAWSPDVVILDEAQRIKNWTTRTAAGVKKIASPYAIVLTGTPLENRLEELVSIVDFVDRHRLGPTFRLLHDHQVRDELGRVVGYRDLDRIGRTLAPVLLRRRKSEVLDQLPPRLEKLFHVPMTPEQMRHHDENREVVARLVAKWRRHRFLSETDQRRLMIALQNMRMACDSSYLLDVTSDHGTKADELVTVLDELFERRGVKAVVFSQWVRMHELLARRLKERGWSHVFFHGGIESAKRKELVDCFRDDPRCRVFLSTDAGGVGLNLQHASVVVNVDLPWNPAVLEQRIGRVHRLGQMRPVHVLSFVAKGTIEEGMLGLLRFKRSLFGGLLDGGERDVFLGGDRLKRFIESVEKVTTAIPEPLVEEAPRAPASDGPGEDGTARTASSDGRTLAADGAPLASLLKTGVQLVEQLLMAARAQDGGQSSEGDGARPRPFETVRDERTGDRYIKIRIPAPNVVDRVAQSLQALLESLQRV
jgi:superfamily II DNA or RNA helicase